LHEVEGRSSPSQLRHRVRKSHSSPATGGAYAAINARAVGFQSSAGGSPTGSKPLSRASLVGSGRLIALLSRLALLCADMMFAKVFLVEEFIMPEQRGSVKENLLSYPACSLKFSPLGANTDVVRSGRAFKVSRSTEN
jgi:hypothetical protein